MPKQRRPRFVQVAVDRFMKGNKNNSANERQNVIYDCLKDLKGFQSSDEDVQTIQPKSLDTNVIRGFAKGTRQRIRSCAQVWIKNRLPYSGDTEYYVFWDRNQA